MKLAFFHLSLLSLFLAVSLTLNAQNDSLKSIMNRGVAYADNQQYDLSLLEYQKAFNIEPKNAWVNYEMALSHYYMENKTRSEKFALVAAKEKSEIGLQAIILLGAIYDERGEHKKSIKTYKKGIKNFGDYYLLWYNLGVTANTMQDYELAQEAFLSAITNKLDHANSHYAVASIMMKQNRRPEALLPLYFFLLIEASTERSEMAFTDIKRLMERGVKTREENGEKVIELQVLNPEGESPMGQADLFLSMLEASKTTEKNQGKSEFELFEENTTAFFKYMGELDFDDRKDFYTNYYIPLFSTIGNGEYTEAFCHYIRQRAYPDSQEWVSSHTMELSNFFDWLDGYDLGQ